MLVNSISHTGENPMGKLLLNLRDYSDEYTATSIAVGELVGTDVWSLATGLTDAFVGHVEAHSIGTVVTAAYKQSTQADDDSRPSDAWAQRELGFRFYVRDDVTSELGYFTVGTADLDIGSVVAGSDELDLTASPTAAFVSWLETNAKSRDGNAITVERAIIVGRNS